MGAPDKKHQRLVQVDALRGLAALAVVLFHYTTQYQKLFPTLEQPAFFVPWGHLGVNLFFIISGFVIFMTLERTARPMDFVVSRFSRLFPSYWLAIVLTFTVVSLWGLPGKEVGLVQAIANLVMLHGIFRVPHVDGVYWTLEVEMLFYIAMFTLYRCGRLKSVHLALAALLGLKVVYFLAAQVFGIDLPWMIYRLLFLAALPWFALGICIYQLNHDPAPGVRHRAIATAIGAIAVLFITEPWYMGLLALGMAAVAHLAARDRLAPLRTPVLAWLGSISYPLYLLHENIGWVLMTRLHATGLPLNACIALTLCFSLLLATLVTRLVEQPAMKAIRGAYKRHRALGTQQAPNRQST